MRGSAGRDSCIKTFSGPGRSLGHEACMKTFQIILLAFAMGCSARYGVAQNAPGAGSENDSSDKAKKLIQEAIEALGGPAYLNVRDMQQQGRGYQLHHGQSSGNGVVFWRFVVFPDKERVEVTKERDVAELYVGNKGYEITYKGARQLDEKDMTDYLRRRKVSLDLVLRQWVNEKGMAFFYEGMGMSGNRPAEQVTLVSASNEAVTLLLDPSNHLPIGKKFSWRDPVDKQINLEEETYDNYRLVGGIATAFNTSRFFNGDMAGQRFLNSVSYNENPDPAMFDANSGYNPNKAVKKK